MNLLSSTSSSKAGKLVWFSCELTNRGIIREYFEIDRILEHEIPEEPFPVYELIGNLSFKQYFKKKIIKIVKIL